MSIITYQSQRENRMELYSQLIENETRVIITKGKNLGKQGVVVKVTKPKDGKYGTSWHSPTFYYNLYFSVVVDIGDKNITTSCDYIKILE